MLKYYSSQNAYRPAIRVNYKTNNPMTNYKAVVDTVEAAAPSIKRICMH